LISEEKARLFSNIPDELKADNSWVLWKREYRDDKPTKVLYQASRRRASSTDSATWTTFEQAVEAFEKHDFDGVGFVFHPGNPYAGADIDDVTEDEAQKWIEKFNSYAERSPSGNGFHIICKAEVTKGTNRDEGELYSSGRFFTMTGDVVRDLPVRDAQDAADEFYSFLRRGEQEQVETRASTSPDLTDAEVVRLAEDARNGSEFQVVYRGGGQFKSDSERDLSLASRLAFWTQDESQIDRIMRGSGCVRDKWTKHRTYLRDTINKALSSLSETYTPAGRARPVRAGKDAGVPTEDATGIQRKPRFERIDLGEVIESGIEEPEMLVPEVLYTGRVHCIFSAGGTGKTFKALYLIKQVIEQDKSVILLDLENGIRIIGERLRDLGADADTVRKHLHYYPFPSLPLSLEATEDFETILEEVRPELVVVDSWINCISAAGLDENSSTDIARWTDAYPQRARQRGIGVLLLDHVPKEGNTARGSGRKLDYVDAMWELRNPQKFDRRTVGRIDMHLRKDREGWLPKVLTYSVGAGDEGFVFERSLGTVDPIDEHGLYEKERQTLEALKDYGQYGAKDSEWKETANSRSVSKSSFYTAKKKLLDLNLVHKVMDKYFVNSLQNSESSESNWSPVDSTGPRWTGKSSESSVPKHWTTGPTAEPHPQDCFCEECTT
jgi:hypothetical protein